jgi:Tfp pilus assembly protein PilO
MGRSQSERLWLIAGGIAAFVMVLVGYFFFISPQQDETADVEDQVASVQTTNDALEAKIAHLAMQYKDLPRYQRLATQARLALPDTAALSAFLRTLQSIGSATSTSVSSLAAGTPVDVSTAAGVQAATPAATPAATNDSIIAAAGGAPVAAGGAGTAPTTVVAPAAGRVYGLPITATITGSVSELNDFLTQLQAVQPRAVLITQLSESVADGNGTRSGKVTSMTLSMFAFVAPGTAAESNQLQTAAAGR